MKWYTLIICLVLLASCNPARKDSNKEKAEDESGLKTGDERILIGWGGGKAEELVPGAADIGFDKLVVHHEDSANFRKFIALGKKNNIGIYAWFTLGDIPAWKKAFPGTDPPLQVMNDEENEALKRIRSDTTVGKSYYQFGGEPFNKIEVLTGSLLCFHDPRVLIAFKKQIDEMLSFEGIEGVALDYIGYQNYHCCYCPASQAGLNEYRRQHPELSADSALKSFSLETMVDFNNQLSDYIRSIRPDAKVMTHVYPVYLPEPLYGNRLDVDICGQTGAWYFEPLWSVEKIREYATIIARDAKKYYERPTGAALIGYYNQPDRYNVKSEERLMLELETIINSGCPHIQVCGFDDVVQTPYAAKAFKTFYGKQAEK